MATYRPHPRLRDRVLGIDVVENDGGDSIVLPSASAVLGFQFRGRVRNDDSLLARAGITGIQSTARRYTYLGATGSVLVRFTPQGATCLGVPPGELAGRSVPLDALLPATRVAQAVEQLCEAQDAATRASIVDQLLLDLPFTADSLVSRAVARFDAPLADDVTIARVARELSMSERQLERRFLARVGVTPKRFATLRRFERAVALAATAPSLTSAAIDAGYYDQSHFIRDFQRFVGSAPGDFLRTRR
jgi:AraC-like DNA-binding protein